MTAANSTQHPLAGELKFCTKCKIGKPRSEYHIGKEYPDGHKATCKVCMQAQRRAKYHSQREHETAKRRARKATPEWQKANAERLPAVLARQAERIAAAGETEKICTGCLTFLPADVQHFNRSKTGALGLTSRCKECQASWHRNNTSLIDKDRAREAARENYQRNSVQILQRAKERRRTDPAFALRMRVSCGVRRSLHKTKLGTSWMKLLPYSPVELKLHLESLFTEGMSWDRLLSGDIEIDHVIPVSFFNPATPDCLEFHMCWSLKNLQPLWREDNRVKSNNLPANFTELWNELYEEAIGV